MTTTNIIYALLAGVLPAIFWLWFWLREDNLHPEPRILITSLFFCGAIAIIPVMYLERYVAEMLFSTNIQYTAWATIEEIIKFSVVALIALKSKNMDEPIDAMIYCITVALGFAALENALFILSPLNTGDITKSIVTGNMRFIGATLVHIVSSASIGFMIGLTFYKNIFIKTISIIIGVILAIILHTSFNLFIINATAIDTFKIFGLVWIAVVILIILFEEIKAIKPKTI